MLQYDRELKLPGHYDREDILSIMVSAPLLLGKILDNISFSVATMNISNLYVKLIWKNSYHIIIFFLTFDFSVATMI